MAINKLSAGSLKKQGPAKLLDGGGLWLYITANNARRWVFRYTTNGKRTELGLGSLNTHGLADARKLATKLRAIKLSGADPRSWLHGQRSDTADKATWTFGKCAAQYIKAHEGGWSNPVHRQQWKNTIDQYCQSIKDLPVDAVETRHLVAILQPIWLTKHVTASRVRGRIENILAWAVVHEHRQKANVAIWRGHLKLLLPKYTKPVIHHSAMPYGDVPGFMATLASKPTLPSLALQLCILTATRTNEVMEARREEIQGDLWTIPADRMKGGVEHHIPLTGQALSIIDQLPPDNWLIPSRIAGRHLSNGAMLKFLKDDMGQPFTVHGFRSSFRDWAASESSHPREVCEHALAHKLKDAVEAAYQRSTLLEKRKLLMIDWADYCQQDIGAEKTSTSLQAGDQA